MEAINLKMVVERIEEGTAVLLVRPDEAKEIYWPRELLPPDIREGHIIRVDLEIDRKATKKAEERVSDLIQRLKKRNGD